MTDGHFTKENLVRALRMLRDNAYLTMCKLSDTELCRGEDRYLNNGKFDKTRLEAHRQRAEWLGKHRAYQQVIEIIERGPPK